MRSPSINHPTQVLDFLAGWPLRHLINIALSIFLVIIALAIVPRAPKPMAPHVTASITVTNTAALAQRIADAHLFGQNAAPSASQASAAPAADIKVQGLIYSDDPTAALAILEIDGDSGFFRVGDVLADGETLAAIAPTAVQLTQGTARRVVELPLQFSGAGSGMALAGAASLGANGQLLPASAALDSYKPALRPVSVPEDATPLDQLRALRAELIKH